MDDDVGSLTPVSRVVPGPRRSLTAFAGGMKDSALDDLS